MKSGLVVVVCALVLGLATEAAANAGMRPYRLAAVRACLIREGVRLVPDSSPIPYPEIVGELDWGFGNGDIFIAFAADPSHGSRLEQRFKQLAYSFGGTAAEIKRGIILRGNVVYYANTFTGLSLSRAGTISRCLR